MTTAPTRRLQLHFIRHGETEWSLSGQHTSGTDIPLTARGEEQARSLRPCLRQIQFSHVFVSPRRRARHTCELAGLGQAAETEPDLAEWDYGDYEGQRSADIRLSRPHWNVFLDGCPNGEMPGDISARADRLLARLATLEGDVALFSHAHFGAVLAARWVGLPVLDGRRFPLGVASLSILAYDPNHPDVRVIGLWNAAPDRHPCQMADGDRPL